MVIPWPVLVLAAVVASGIGTLAWLYGTADTSETVAVAPAPTGAVRLVLYGLRLVAAAGLLYVAAIWAFVAWQSVQPFRSPWGVVGPRVGPAALGVALAVVGVGLALWTIRAPTVRSAAARLIISWLVGLGAMLLPVLMPVHT